MCVSLSVIIAAPLTRFGCTMGRMHCDSEPLKIGMLVMSHSLIRSLVRLHRSLTRLLRTARFILLPSLARCCVHSFARSLTHSLPSSWDNGIFLSNFQCVLNHSGMTMKSTHKVLGHSLVRSLVHSHCTFIHFLRTARFARALCCAHSFVRSLAHSLAPELQRTDGQTDRLTNGRTDRRTDRPTDGQTDGRTDRRKDRPSYRDARTHLIMTGKTA